MQIFSQDKLEEVAKNSLYTTFTNSTTIEYSFEVFKRHLTSGSILELGPAEGLMTKHLAAVDASMFVIEGSSHFAQELHKKFAGITIINALFEQAVLPQKFNNVILGHVLEHVENPQQVLNKIKEWLAPEGVVMCAVPNARSIHRQAAVEMGLIDSIFSMSEKDLHHGHMRIYTPETLSSEFIKAGFNIKHKGGYWLKPVSDAQIQKSWSQEMLNGFMRLGEYYPDIAGEIYVICNL